MFAPAGWISLSDVVSQLKWIIADDMHYGLIDHISDDLFELVWLFTLEADDVAVCLQTGAALPVSRMLLHTSNPTVGANSHVDLTVGTVGSSYAPKQSSQEPSDFELRSLYGPFLHLPIIFLETNFIEFCEGLQEPSEGVIHDEGDFSSANQDRSPQAVSEAIIQLFDNGELSKFDDARLRLGEGMSVRGFRFAWGMARLQRPNISKPGRKPLRTIS